MLTTFVRAGKGVLLLGLYSPSQFRTDVDCLGFKANIGRKRGSVDRLEKLDEPLPRI